MKQLLQHLRDGRLEVAEVPVPSPMPGTALVRTAASLVSAGTERMVVEFAEKSLVGKAAARPDLVSQVLDKAKREGVLNAAEAAFRRLDQPMPLGYASAGTVVEVGEGLQGFQVGQRVACAGGGYAVHAEYAIVPQNLLAALPEEVDFEAAAFTTLGAIALNGFRLAEVGLGERVAVIGLGLLGLLSVGIARAAGCKVLGVDLDAKRVELAAKMGAEAVLREGAEEAAVSFSGDRGCDAVLVCADTESNDPVELAGRIVRDRAKVVVEGAVGMQVPRKRYYAKELSLLVSRSYGPGRYDPGYEEGGQDYPIGYVRWTEGRNLGAFVEILASGVVEVNDLITHRFPIEQAMEAYDLITGKRQEPFLGVLLTYPKTEIPEPRTIRTLEGEPSKRGKSEQVSLGVIGAGNFASAVLLPAIKGIPKVELVGVASASGLTASQAAKRFGFRYASSEVAQILGDEEINTVAVLTRHNLHAAQVSAALEAGKNVFCEKPLALNENDLDEIAAALEKPDCPLLTVGFNRRFAPLAVELMKFMVNRREPFVAHYRVNAGYLPPEHWLQDREEGGGRIVGEGCHFIDLLTFLNGSPPKSVFARALPDGGRYRQDNVVMDLGFGDGSIGTVSYLANGDSTLPKERLEVFAGGRVAVLDDFRRLETFQDGRRKVYRSRLRQDKGHRAEWDAFARAVVGGAEPPIPYEHLIGVTKATFAALESLRKGEEIPLR